jgi:hypothetical protein
MPDETEVDPKAPEWFRQEVARQREARRVLEEQFAKKEADYAAKLEAVAKERADLAAAAQKAQAERDRVARQYAMHKEGLASERLQRQLLRDFDDVRSEQGDKAPDFSAWLAEQKKDPDGAAFFKAPAAAPAPAATPVAAPAPTPAPSPAAPNADRGVVVVPAVLAKDRDRTVVEMHQRGELKGAALRAELIKDGMTEEQAKRFVP